MSIQLHLSPEFRRRLPILLAGYVAACLVGGIVIILVMLLPWRGPLNVDSAILSVASLLVLFASMLIFIFALAPSIVMLIYAERHAVRSPAWYAIAGIAIAVLGGIVHLLFVSVFDGAPPDGLLRTASKVLLNESALTLPAGICAGLTFWAIAGRHVGKKPEIS